jgi:hypothetical protein
MNKKDKQIIKTLMKQNYKVVVQDPSGETFSERYRVYQAVGFGDLKVVIINDEGTVVGLQG